MKAIILLLLTIGHLHPCHVKSCSGAAKRGENLCIIHQTDSTVLLMTEKEFNNFDLRTPNK